MASRHQSSDAGNSDTTKKSHKVLPLSENVKVLNKEKKNTQVTKIFGKNDSSICEIVKKKKETRVSSLSHLKL